MNTQHINEIMEELKDNQLDMFDLLYQETSRQLYLHILSIVKNSATAEEVLQETYLKILKNVRSWKKNTNALNWMITIARNEAINTYNKRKREVQANPQESDYLFQEEPNRNTPLIELMYLILTNQEIELITLHAINGLTHKEIAKILKKPIGTVSWQYNQAIKKLREKAGEIDDRS